MKIPTIFIFIFTLLSFGVTAFILIAVKKSDCDKIMEIYVAASGGIKLDDLKKHDPKCTSCFLSNMLDCTKKNYDLDKLYDIVLQKDLSNTYWINYKGTLGLEALKKIGLVVTPQNLLK